MPAETAHALALAYTFLRRTEHRIQFLDDQQTHLIPIDEADLHWLARAMGFEGASGFLCALDIHRETVAGEFDRLLANQSTGGEADCGGCAATAAAGQSVDDGLDAMAGSMPASIAARVAVLRRQPKVLALRDAALARLLQLLQRTLRWVASEGDGALTAAQREAGALRWLDWMEALLRRESYLALLQERPSVHLRVLRLLGCARWSAQYLLRHPGVIDELVDADMLAGRFDAVRFEADVQARRAALRSSGEDDDEALLNLLRRAHHAEVFRTLARDVDGRISLPQVADDLSALADCVLGITAQWCWQRLKNRHRDAPQFAVIGYGKLGGQELGYGSDLDIVFVYDDEDERAGEVYAAYVRKLINWLSVKTAEGDLFEIDTALRPNGSAGLLVSSWSAYAAYQAQRGSNAAWTWEHQAMTRARVVLDQHGAASPFAERFDAVRQAVLCAPRDALALRGEILAMRSKIRAAHPSKATEFDVKHGPGGMVDAEFAVQYLVLLHASVYPAMRANAGNMALLHTAQACGLLPAAIAQAAQEAYGWLRQAQHSARLDERPTQVSPHLAQEHAVAIEALLAAVFGGSPG